MNESFELPSLQEIQEMERQRSQAIESLEIYDHSVKCQRCGMTIPIVGKLARPHNDRVAILQKRIKWMENYYHGNIRSDNDDLKTLRQELTELLEEDAKADKLRSLPLYSCRLCIAAELLISNSYVQSVMIRYTYMLMQRPWNSQPLILFSTEQHIQTQHDNFYSFTLLGDL